MSGKPAEARPRCAVVDLGSNSVRLVVFERAGRTPSIIFNEKAVLRLGRGLQSTGRLNDDAVAGALTVLRRYHTIARAMHADPFEVLATAAVREASNGAAFVGDLQQQLQGVPIRILSGEREAALSADGLLCGMPDANGVLADIGGGSLEVVRLDHGRPGGGHTLKLGLIRLAERAGGDPARAARLAGQDLAAVTWLAEAAGLDLYLVGGAWRALARVNIARVGYPLNIVDHYTIDRDTATDLAAGLAAAPARTLERMPGAPRRRVEDLPFAAVVLRQLLRATGAARVVFSASGIREGWYMRGVSPAIRGEDPLLAAARDYSRQLGRDPSLPPALLAWTDPLFPHEPAQARRLRETACWLSDIGSHDHPEYRAEQAFLRVLRQPGVGMGHPARAFLAMAVAIRYEAEPEAPFIAAVTGLIDAEARRRATVLGCALRLAYTLSGGTVDLLRAARLDVNGALILRLEPGSGVFAGDSVTRRLERLAAAVGMSAATEPAALALRNGARAANRTKGA